MPETRVKARRYRILQLGTFDCITQQERILYDDYKNEKDKERKKTAYETFNEKLGQYDGIREIPRERLLVRDKCGNLTSEYIESKQNPMFEGVMARLANDFTTEFPLIKEIVYFDCSLRVILKQIIDNGIVIDGEKYIFYSATTNQMKKEMIILLQEKFFSKNQNKIMCGLSMDSINKGNDRVKGCNRGKYLAYTSLPMSASVELLSISTESEKYEIEIDDCIVVDDFEGIVHDKVNYLDMKTLKTEIKEMDIPVPFMDGSGIFLPNAGVLPRTAQIRGSYMKGCLFPFDFVKFIDSNINKGATSKIKDIYGDTVDVIADGIKVIFTGSQFKMWKYYDNWDEFKRIFKECDCHIVVNNLAHHPTAHAEVKLSYQFLQTIQRYKLTNDAIKNLCKKTVDKLNGAKKEYNAAMEYLNVSDDKEMQPQFAAVKMYPKLINDVDMKSMIQTKFQEDRLRAMGGKILVEGFYSYICPDLYAFCEHIFCGIESPDGLIPKEHVYNSYYNDTDITEVDCLRSPHLGDSEHCVRTLYKADECREWFSGTDTVISNHDLITKHLMCDCDGDEMLITSSQELISLIERDKPALYYDMNKAENETITHEVLYNCLIDSFDNSIIGDISNTITKLYAVNGNPDYDFIRILSAYNNFVIDFPKTQIKPSLLEYEKLFDEWKDFKIRPLPRFFKYSKKKSEKVIMADYTDCNVDRIAVYIGETVKKGKHEYDIFSDEKEDQPNPEMLKNKDIEVVRNSDEYENLVELMRRLKDDAQNHMRHSSEVKKKFQASTSIDESNLKLDIHYFLCGQAISRIFNGDIAKAANYLVDIEYYYPEFLKCSKKIMWYYFGNIICENIQNNIEDGVSPKIRRPVYNTISRKASNLLEDSIQMVNNETAEHKKQVEEKKITVVITEEEYNWISKHSQNFRKNCGNDFYLLFILLYMQKKYEKNGWFKIHRYKKNGITRNTIDTWIESDVCKKGIKRLKDENLISTAEVSNSKGQYTHVRVNIPEFNSETPMVTVDSYNPLISLFEATEEKVIKECEMCHRKYVAVGNLKTCSKKCSERLQMDTKLKCNKNMM